MPLVIKRKTTKPSLKKRHVLFIGNIIILIIMIYRAVYIAYHFGAFDLGHFYVEELNIRQSTAEEGYSPDKSSKNDSFYIEVSINLSKCTCPLYLEFIDISGHLFQSEDKNVSDPSISVLVSKIKFDKKKPFEFNARLELKTKNMDIPLLDLITQEFRIEIRFITKARFCYIPLCFSRIIRRKKSQLIRKGGESVDLSFLSTKIDTVNGLSCLKLGLRKKFFTLINNKSRFVFDVGCLKVYFEGIVDFFVIVNSFSTDIFKADKDDSFRADDKGQPNLNRIIPGIPVNDKEDPDESIVFYFISIPIVNIENLLKKLTNPKEKYLKVKKIIALPNNSKVLLDGVKTDLEFIENHNPEQSYGGIPVFIGNSSMNKFTILDLNTTNTKQSDKTTIIGGWTYDEGSFSFNVGIGNDNPLFLKILELYETSSFIKSLLSHSSIELTVSIKEDEVMRITVSFDESIHERGFIEKEFVKNSFIGKEFIGKSLIEKLLAQKRLSYAKQHSEFKQPVDEDKKKISVDEDKKKASVDGSLFKVKCKMLKRCSVKYKELSNIVIDLNKIVLCGININKNALFKIHVDYPHQVSLITSKRNPIILYKFQKNEKVLHSVIIKHVLSDHPASNFLKVVSEIDLGNCGFVTKKISKKDEFQESSKKIKTGSSDISHMIYNDIMSLIDHNKNGDSYTNKNSSCKNENDYKNRYKNSTNNNGNDYKNKNSKNNKNSTNNNGNNYKCKNKPKIILNTPACVFSITNSFMKIRSTFAESPVKYFSSKTLAGKIKFDSVFAFQKNWDEYKEFIDAFKEEEISFSLADGLFTVGVTINDVINENKRKNILKGIPIVEEQFLKVFPFEFRYAQTLRKTNPSKLSIVHLCKNLEDLRFYALCRDPSFYNEHSLYNEFRSLDPTFQPFEDSCIPSPFFVKNVLYSEKVGFTKIVGGMPIHFRSDQMSMVLTFTSKNMFVYFPKVTEIDVNFVNPTSLVDGVDRWVSEECPLHRLVDFILDAAFRLPTNSPKIEALKNIPQKGNVIFDVDLEIQENTVFSMGLQIKFPKGCLPGPGIVTLDFFGNLEISSYDRKDDLQGFYFSTSLLYDNNCDDEYFVVKMVLKVDLEYAKDTHSLEVKFNGDHVSFTELNFDSLLKFITGIFIPYGNTSIKEEVEFLGETFVKAFSKEDFISPIYKFNPIIVSTQAPEDHSIPPFLDVKFKEINGEELNIDFSTSVGVDNLMLYIGDLLFKMCLKSPVTVIPEYFTVNIDTTNPFSLRWGDQMKNFLGFDLKFIKTKNPIKIPIKPFTNSTLGATYNESLKEHRKSVVDAKISSNFIDLNGSLLSGDFFNIGIDIFKNFGAFKLDINEPYQSIFKTISNCHNNNNSNVIEQNSNNSNITSNCNNSNIATNCNNINSNVKTNQNNNNIAINQNNSNSNTAINQNNGNIDSVMAKKPLPFLKIRGKRYPLFLFDLKIPCMLRFVDSPLYIFTNSTQTVNFVTVLNGLLLDLSVAGDGYNLTIPLQIYEEKAPEELVGVPKLNFSNFNYQWGIKSNIISQNIFLLLKKNLICYKCCVIDKGDLGFIVKTVLSFLGKKAIYAISLKTPTESREILFTLVSFFTLLMKKDAKMITDEIMDGILPDESYLKTVRKYMMNEEVVNLMGKCLKIRKKDIENKLRGSI